MPLNPSDLTPDGGAQPRRRDAPAAVGCSAQG